MCQKKSARPARPDSFLVSVVNELLAAVLPPSLIVKVKTKKSRKANPPPPGRGSKRSVK
jgi:hypothetical protein